MSQVYVFTGEGKGKTSAALGMTLRARCSGMRVAWVAWYKEATWDVSEYKMKDLLGVDLFIEGKGFYFEDRSKVKKTKVGAVVDKATNADHKKAATHALNKAAALIESQKYDLIILDEVCQAAGDRLIKTERVLGLINKKGTTHLVLTGRHCPEEIIKVADTVTEMKKIKHAYDQGVAALKGLDF